jgi:hypothetical protein
MHGAFVVGLNEMVTYKYGKDVWSEILELAGFEPNYRPLSNQEVNDKEAVFLVKTITKKLNLGDKLFGEVFGDYWIKRFAKEKYFAFLDAFKSVKDFLEKINEIHQKLTENLNNHKPPVFDIQWENTQSAAITYISDRQLIHIAVGTLKALGEYYHDEISVFKVDTNKIKVLFKN